MLFGGKNVSGDRPPVESGGRSPYSWEFSKICKDFFEKCSKTAIFEPILEEITQNLRLVEQCKILGIFWEKFENIWWKFNKKSNFSLSLEKLLLKNRSTKNFLIMRFNLVLCFHFSIWRFNHVSLFRCSLSSDWLWITSFQQNEKHGRRFQAKLQFK